MSLRALLFAGCYALCVSLGGLSGLAAAQRASPAAPKAAPAAKPTWNELTGEQREALAPLAAEWDTFDRDRKKKWLEVAKKYPQLSDEGKQRVHTRMKDFARLTPEERRTARENFQRAYELPMDERQARLEQYKKLPEDKRRELAEQAKTRPPASKPAAPAQRKSER
jgi:hypothetical protein